MPGPTDAIHPFGVMLTAMVTPFHADGSLDLDLNTEPLGTGSDGKPVMLRDIWPSPAEVSAVVDASIDSQMFASRYAGVFDGDSRWQGLPVPTGINLSLPSVSQERSTNGRYSLPSKLMANKPPAT